jgi:hypothetical protein
MLNFFQINTYKDFIIARESYKSPYARNKFWAKGYYVSSPRTVARAAIRPEIATTHVAVFPSFNVILLEYDIQAGLLFCGLSKNIRIIDRVFQDIRHDARITVPHCFIPFQNIRGNTDCYRLFLLAPVTFSR